MSSRLSHRPSNTWFLRRIRSLMRHRSFHYRPFQLPSIQATIRFSMKQRRCKRWRRLKTKLTRQSLRVPQLGEQLASTPSLILNSRSYRRWSRASLPTSSTSWRPCVNLWRAWSQRILIIRAAYSHHHRRRRRRRRRRHRFLRTHHPRRPRLLLLS